MNTLDETNGKAMSHKNIKVKRKYGITFKSLFFKDKSDTFQISRFKNNLSISIVLAALILLLIYSFSKLNYNLRLQTLYQYRYKFYMGFAVTVLTSMCSLVLSLVIGIFFAFARNSRFLPLHYFSKFYVEAIRGTPLLVQIYVFFYIVATAFNLTNRYFLGILILSIFSGAYVSEIIRGGIESIGKSQIETARSLGFSPYQKYRFIIIPQVIKRIMPSLAGQFVSLVKDSSLLSIIAVNEFTKNVQEVDSINFASIENYMVLAIGYLILTLPISVISKKLERKYTYES
ncbi:amino acid ABC transporter membrane protein, PAAT family (TC 3.A.1.3.-) [Peptoclostridium litorale DSM 5388]|uniref:Putative glutamine ABC transporter permease protein GlnM n=1 Tax=Peptoclostridium litorale DSM 5388 TaxID=1121324 RepID=A0A069RDP0_PEPLI|nr:amino acid ABC transporter permease [Peptoclostridium litorale]KDR95131.1 putative glutamine ABC transporter permease protein GlnM [Peptoclostridium litorale DSM 5388]SIN74516.1 amino acid ABC transporter membrane protein, PAAT family (TC 3.A.1.3.-) [Peptoclostridium litorale DSM 5388]